jgi:hypothetical protein
MFKRKHVRTRKSEVGHLATQTGGIGPSNKLVPGTYRIMFVDRSLGHDRQRYVGSFVLRQDQTVALYGSDMAIVRAGDLQEV